mgnify:CR=1 FL=1
MIEAMKQALEALEKWAGGADEPAITALRQAIAEAEKQEPVAWTSLWALDGSCNIDFDVDKVSALPVGTKLYTHPPKREPLTDEQIEKIIKANMSLQMNLAGIRQDFEAAHGIKGEA